MIKRTGFLFMIVLMLMLAAPLPARADGVIIPGPCPEPGMCPGPSSMFQLEIKYHRVEVVIDQQIAVTHVDQVFYNPNDWAVEGTYVFPMPLDAAVSSFTLWVDGKPVKGEILDAEQARQVYQQIVSNLRDPALLEYAGRGALKASIFPIPPRGERRIELEYSQALSAEDGLVNYVYPLSTEKFSLTPLEQVSVTVDIRSNVPIRAVYSPSHPLAIERSSDLQLTASYQASNVLPDSDFSLYYSLGETEAFHLLSYRDPQDPQDADGFFLLLLAPSLAEITRPLPKDIILVLDHSGSMEGEKFVQAQAAARYILDHLNPEDHFNLVTFSSDLQTFARELQPASEAGRALEWVDRLSAVGGTDINRALLESAMLVDSQRPTYLIFLTDGLPTVGVVESESILENFAATAPENVRLFAFGVGYDVDTFLLDSLAQEYQGISFYVQPEERLDEALSTFYAKINAPVLTDLELDFGGMSVYDLYPSPLPDLFRGSQIIALGRYRDGGEVDVRLGGQVESSDQSFSFPGQVFTRESPPGDALGNVLPHLWATRKIGYLLKQVRLHGADQETVDQIVRLSIRYGIVTPYTSYLVTEDQPLGEAAREQLVEQSLQVMQMPAAVSGRDAVQKASGEQELSMAESLPLAQDQDGTARTDQNQGSGRVRNAGGRAYILQGSTWVDTAFDPEKMQTTKVAFLSPEYFSLVKENPTLGPAFALGSSVIALVGDAAFEVIVSEREMPDVISGDSTSQDNPDINQPNEDQVIEPVLPVISDPSTQDPSPTSGSLPCLGGLLPVLLVGGWLMWKKR